MRILQRYIGKHVLQMTGIVLLALLGLEIFMLLMSQLNSLGNGDYGLPQVFLYVLLNLPEQLYGLFPMAGLLGVLLALGILASHSELIVMRAAGLSILNISEMVMKAVLLLILIASLIGEVIAPLAARTAIYQKQFAISKGQALTTARGVWVRDRNDFIHIQKVLSEHRVEGITRYQFNDQQELARASFAERGYYENSGWKMTNIRETQFLDNRTKAIHVSEATWHLGINPTVLRDVELDASAMTLPQLYETIRYHHQIGIHQSSEESAFWQRILQPFSSCVMMFLAIPFVFGPLRGVNLSLKLLAGIGAGFGFYILNQLFTPLSVVLQWPPFVSAVLPTLLFAGVGFILLKRIR